MQSKLGIAVETIKGLQNVVGSVKGFLQAQKWGGFEDSVTGGGQMSSSDWEEAKGAAEYSGIKRTPL